MSHVKAIVDKVHKHVCGHFSLTDFGLHMAWNEIWNEAVAKYVQQVFEHLMSCNPRLHRNRTGWFPFRPYHRREMISSA